MSETLAAEARAWYQANWDPDLPTGEWYRRLFEARWGYPTWPEQWGGRGLSVGEAKVVRDERRRAGALAPPSGIGPSLLAPMLFRHGDDDQCERFCRGMAYRGWTVCQMLSEPDAGSDLAGCRTTAERDGDEWRITGSKIWTSNADIVDYGMLLARTRWDLPKHQGLTFFLIRRDQPGIEIRPLRQMTGEAHFNQVFFDGARVPAADVLGGELNGWPVARTFLAYEKNSFNPSAHEGGPFGKVPLDAPAGEVQASLRSPGRRQQGNRGAQQLIAELVERFASADDALARLARVGLHEPRVLMGYTNQRLRGAGSPGWEGPVSKLLVSELTRRQRDVGLAVQGPHGTLEGSDAPSPAFQRFALGTPATSIAGGTDEIQRNSLAERVLGLPGEPKADTDIAFRDVPASGTPSSAPHSGRGPSPEG